MGLDQKFKQRQRLYKRGISVSGLSGEEEKRLLELTQEQYDLYKQFLELTRRQTDLLAEDDAEGFGRSLDYRQELIEKINGLHQDSDILMQSYMSAAIHQDQGTAAAIAAATERVADILKLCVAENDKNAATAKNMAGDYIKQIEKLNRNKKGIGAYIHKLPNKSELFDRKS